VVNNAVTTTSQYIDTGVLLQVTPHINAGGLVTLDVQAEVSTPGNFVPGEAPPINTRSVQTIVSVQSGQTMIMGGLIGETKQNQSQGLPLLSRIPIIGGLFGDQQLQTNRTELVMFITPSVIETELDLRNIIDDLRKKMASLEGLLPSQAWGAAKIFPPSNGAEPPGAPSPPSAPPATPEPSSAPQAPAPQAVPQAPAPQAVPQAPAPQAVPPPPADGTQPPPPPGEGSH
jgi:type II secretory pathway component GspD/PulD (secretin)